jgi:Ras-related protein Rab-21
VYDVTDANSWERVRTWVKELHKIVGENIVLAIVGNKIDLRNRVVDLEKAKEYAAEVGAIHYETSAKNNSGVTEMFSDVTRSKFFHVPYLLKGIVEADGQQQPEDEGFGAKRSPSKKGFVLDDKVTPEQKQEQGSTCCGSSSQ